MSQLNVTGKQLLNGKFHGVYPCDKIPKLTESSPYAILNLDNSKQRGSHWISIAKNGDNTVVYDSFGRNHIKIIPSLKLSGNGNIINTDDDAEQKMNQNDCGARSITWLILYDKWGNDLAILI